MSRYKVVISGMSTEQLKVLNNEEMQELFLTLSKRG